MTEVGKACASHQPYVSGTDDSDPHIQAPGTESLERVMGSDLSDEKAQGQPEKTTWKAS
jgi:hypothetical protein